MSDTTMVTVKCARCPAQVEVELGARPPKGWHLNWREDGAGHAVFVSYAECGECDKPIAQLDGGST
jgi:hypothetical protein